MGHTGSRILCGLLAAILVAVAPSAQAASMAPSVVARLLSQNGNAGVSGQVSAPGVEGSVDAQVSAEEKARIAEEVRKKIEAEERAKLAEKRRIEAEMEAALKKKAAAKEEEEEEERKERKKKDGKEEKEASLNLPFKLYAFTAALSGLGYATGLLSRNAERNLRDPAKHINRAETTSNYNVAYYGGFVSAGFYSASAALGGWAAYKTQSAVRGYIQAKAGLAQNGGVAEGEEAFAVVVPEVEAQPFDAQPAAPAVSGALGVSPRGDVSVLFSFTF